MASTTRGKILIAGAGIGGLVAASCLLKQGWDVEIYEQAPELREIGAGIQLSANAMHVLRHLGLEERILEVGVRPRAYVFRLHDTGEIIQTFALSDAHEATHGAPYVQLHRADLLDILLAKARALKPNLIRLGRQVVGFEERETGVILRFADGAIAEGDMLIGADGIKSAIRAQAKGKVAPVYTGDSVWRVAVPTAALPPGLFDQVMSVFMGPGRHAVCYYVRAGTLLNFVSTVEAPPTEESWTMKLPWAEMKATYAGWYEGIQAVLDAADRNECYRWSLYIRPSLGDWSTERVTILGDAAHPTLPYLAQGAAMAIEDGLVLARALDDSASIAAGLDLYARNRVERTARVVAQSTANQHLFHLSSEAEIRRRFAGRDEGADRNAWLYSYRPQDVALV